MESKVALLSLRFNARLHALWGRPLIDKGQLNLDVGQMNMYNGKETKKTAVVRHRGGHKT